MSPLRKILAIVLLFTAFTGGAVFLYLALEGGGTPVHATVLPEARPLPEFSLIDDGGKPFTRASLQGSWHLLFFGFTHCPDICPATLQQLAIARNRVKAVGGEFPEIVLVSVDPERDTPDILAAYVANFGEGITGVTGSLDALATLTRPLGIFFAKSGDAGGDYTVDHSAVVLLIDPAANWKAVFSTPHDVSHFVDDVPLLTGG